MPAARYAETYQTMVAQNYFAFLSFLREDLCRRVQKEFTEDPEGRNSRNFLLIHFYTSYSFPSYSTKKIEMTKEKKLGNSEQYFVADEKIVRLSKVPVWHFKVYEVKSSHFYKTFSPAYIFIKHRWNHLILKSRSNSLTGDFKERKKILVSFAASYLGRFFRNRITKSKICRPCLNNIHKFSATGTPNSQLLIWINPGFVEENPDSSSPWNDSPPFVTINLLTNALSIQFRMTKNNRKDCISKKGVANWELFWKRQTLSYNLGTDEVFPIQDFVRYSSISESPDGQR